MTFRLKHGLFVGMCVVVVAMGTAAGMPSDDDPSFWYTAPSSPLVFKFPASPTFDNSEPILIRNASGGNIVGYQLGCVFVRNDRAIVTKDVRTYKIGYPIESQDFPTKVAAILANKCLPSSRLSIISVTFKDGSRWQLARK